jgi:hypothetical protein
MSKRSTAASSQDVLRLVAEALAPYLRPLLSQGSSGVPEFYDQRNSPLGHRRHLELVRRGVLSGKRVGKLVLVHRDEVNTFIESRELGSSAGAERDDVLSDWGLRSRGPR